MRYFLGLKRLKEPFTQAPRQSNSILLLCQEGGKFPGGRRKGQQSRLAKTPKDKERRRESLQSFLSLVNTYKGPFTNDVSREGEGGGYPKSDAVKEVA